MHRLCWNPYLAGGVACKCLPLYMYIYLFTCARDRERERKREREREREKREREREREKGEREGGEGGGREREGETGREREREGERERATIDGGVPATCGPQTAVNNRIFYEHYLSNYTLERCHRDSTNYVCDSQRHEFHDARCTPPHIHKCPCPAPLLSVLGFELGQGLASY